MSKAALFYGQENQIIDNDILVRQGIKTNMQRQQVTGSFMAYGLTSLPLF